MTLIIILAIVLPALMLTLYLKPKYTFYYKTRNRICIPSKGKSYPVWGKCKWESGVNVTGKYYLKKICGIVYAVPKDL